MTNTNRTRGGERDFPVGHPAASDYAGEPYSPPRAPHGEDHPEGHPARLGANIPQSEIAERTRFDQPEKATE